MRTTSRQAVPFAVFEFLLFDTPATTTNTDFNRTSNDHEEKTTQSIGPLFSWLQEGYQVDLVPGSAIKCVVSFAPGQERRVYFAGGLSLQMLLCCCELLSAACTLQVSCNSTRSS